MISTRTARLNRQTNNSLQRSRYSHITWQTETRPHLESALSRFAWPTPFRLVQIPRDSHTIQVDLHSDRLFEKPSDDGSTKSSMEREKPASLVISIHLNGAIAFNASGCSSSFAALDSNAFIIGLYRDAQHLAGSAGHKLVEKSLHKFSKLAVISLTERAPTRSDGIFLARLYRISSRFNNLYPTPQDARRAAQSQYIAFAGGLAGGLIASSIFTTLLKVGENLHQQPWYVSIFYQPVAVLLMEIGLTIVSLVVIMRAMHRR